MQADAGNHAHTGRRGCVVVEMQTLTTDYFGFQYGVGLIWIKTFTQAKV